MLSHLWVSPIGDNRPALWKKRAEGARITVVRIHVCALRFYTASDIWRRSRPTCVPFPCRHTGAARAPMAASERCYHRNGCKDMHSTGEGVSAFGDGAPRPGRIDSKLGRMERAQCVETSHRFCRNEPKFGRVEPVLGQKQLRLAGQQW